MKHVLVTGGAGYIGSHACKALKNAGLIPVTFDNFSTGWKDSVKFGPYVRGDLLNKKDIDIVFKKYSPIAVMHFAALSQVGESIIKPHIYWKNNVLGSLNLIQSAIEHSCMNFIFSSTCATYGDQDNVILDESCVQKPTNAYGASKLAVEHMLNHFDIAHGLKYVIFRYFNVAGADSESQIGEFHKPETHLIPLILDAINNQNTSLTINGTDYDTPDGTCIRDYIHVCDLVDTHILGFKWLQDSRQSRIFNLGSGKGYSVREVIKQVEIVTQNKVPLKEGPRRKGDCARLVSGSVRATNELKWNSDRSTLDQMILDAWKWSKKANYTE